MKQLDSKKRSNIGIIAQPDSEKEKADMKKKDERKQSIFEGRGRYEHFSYLPR